MTKKLFLTVATVSIMSGGFVGVTNAFAQTPPPTINPVTSLIQQITDKFHLNKADVQAVFAQNHQQNQTNREAKYEARLEQLVKNEKITDQQRQLLIAEHKKLLSEIQKNRKFLKSMTPAERKTQQNTIKQDIQTWAKQNNINARYLVLLGPGLRGYGNFGLRDQKSPTPTPTPT